MDINISFWLWLVLTVVLLAAVIIQQVKFRKLKLFTEKTLQTYDDVRKHSLQLRDEHSQKKDQLLENEQKLAKQTKLTQRYIDKVKELSETIETLNTQLNSTDHQSELKMEHLEAQAKTTLKQLVQADKERTEFAKKFNELNESLNRVNIKHQKELDELNAHHKAQIIELEKKFHHHKISTDQSTSAEIKKIKRKLQQQKLILQTLKGHKELAEERAKNWESALITLSAHILNRPVTKVSHANEVAKITTEALEKINAHWIEADLPQTKSAELS